LVAWRQNGPLIIQKRADQSTHGCGRSAGLGLHHLWNHCHRPVCLGISRDGTVLYYAVGFGLTLPALTKAVQDAGGFQAIQLDINNFTPISKLSSENDNQLSAVPLLEQMKGLGDHRYLTINKRDFFYVTTK